MQIDDFQWQRLFVDLFFYMLFANNSEIVPGSVQTLDASVAARSDVIKRRSIARRACATRASSKLLFTTCQDLASPRHALPQSSGNYDGRSSGTNYPVDFYRLWTWTLWGFVARQRATRWTSTDHVALRFHVVTSSLRFRGDEYVYVRCDIYDCILRRLETNECWAWMEFFQKNIRYCIFFFFPLLSAIVRWQLIADHNEWPNRTR